MSGMPICSRGDLARRGFEVMIAVNGADCIHQTQTAPPDLILMDVSLPDLDGYEVIRPLIEDETVGKIPIIALTAHAMAGEREKALAVGCNEYEAKPIDLDSLLQKINQCIDASR
jgi:two-component system cell cycle response regulator DivK